MRTQQIVFLRKLTSVVLFVCLASGAFAKPPHWAPAFGYHKKHHYVYYPKQNFYYDPFLGTYIVHEHGVWVRQVRPPRLFVGININILPHVDLYVASYRPYEYNEEHCHRYFLVRELAPPSEFYVYRHPRRYDFSITPYAYYHPDPNLEIAVVFYNPNHYLYREPERHHHGHAYGHYKHHDKWYGDKDWYGSPHHDDWYGESGHGKEDGKGHNKHDDYHHAPVNRPPDKWQSPNSHAPSNEPKRPDLFKQNPNPGKQQNQGKQPKKVDHQQSQPHPIMVARDNNHGNQGNYGGKQQHNGQSGGGNSGNSGGHGGGKGKHGKD